MENSLKPNKEYKNIYRSIIMLFVIICLVIGVFSVHYYNRLSSTIREEGQSYLEEISSRISNSIDRIIKDNFSALQLMASPINLVEKSTIANVSTILKSQKEFWDFNNLLLVDSTGTAYNIQDNKVLLNLDPAINADILNKKTVLSTTQVINNEEFILFSVPLHNISLDGRTMVALAGTYKPAAFDRILSMDSFSKQAYSQIVTKSGTAVTKPTSPYAMKSGYNVFSTLQVTQMDKYSDLSKMQQDIQSLQTGQIGFTYDGVYRYMIYTPLNENKWYVLTFVPVEVVNARSNAMLQFTLLFCSIIILAFAALIFVLAFIFSKHKKSLEEMAYVDTVTNGNTIQRFYILAHTYISAQPQKQYALIFTNLEKFKVLNEQLGFQRCDVLLKFFYDHVTKHLAEDECMGRISGDNFCLLLAYESKDELLNRFENWQRASEQFVTRKQWMQSLPTVEFGIYVIDSTEISFPQMIDRAKLSLRTSPKLTATKIRYALYDDKVRRSLFREKQLEDMMEKALYEGEFMVYLQPKYHLPEEKILGAEALARWKTSTEGMVYPDEFIPLFEKNGFIVKLDHWVFERTCIALRSWMDQGLSPIKISVNCSRVNLQDMSFLENYISVADQYKIDHKYLEIEITESILMENTEYISTIVSKIREAGFGCSMDDFGSGYSSLNLIQTIPVDTLKLDKAFFLGMETDSESTEAVIRGIIQIARALNMEVIAEGVETREQVEILKSVMCDYIQGYYYAKPMDIEAFEEMHYNIKKIEDKI